LSPPMRTPPPKSHGGTRRRCRSRAPQERGSSSRSSGGGNSCGLFREPAPQLREDVGGGAAPAREGCVVHFEEAEGWPESLEPLEVVEQRPVKVAEDRLAGGAPVRENQGMFPEEIAPPPVVVRRNPVLGHEDREPRLRGLPQDDVEAVRVDFPAGVG